MRAETLNWVGGEHDFALTLPLLESLQDRLEGDGVGLIFSRISSGLYKLQDITATVALGLEGGGMKKVDANKKVRALVEDHGIAPLHLTAHAVLGAALNGWPDDAEKSAAGAEANP